jgi:hypothetical protein
VERPTFVPASTHITCPACGEPSEWQPPARQDAEGRVALEYRCARGHEHFMKEKQAGTFLGTR